MNNKRNIKLDALRGIAVIAVLLGHSIQRAIPSHYLNNIIFKIIYTFHMPLFMIISGYSFYKFSQKCDYKSLWKKFCRLIIPTISWSYIIYFVRKFDFVGIKEFVYFPESIIQYTKDLILNPTYIIWFLYTIFICILILSIQNKIFNNKSILKRIICSLMILGLIYLIPTKYFGIDNIKYYFPIFCVGYYVPVCLDIKKYMKYLFYPSIILYLLLFNKYNYGYSAIYINYLISLFGIVIVYNLVDLIKNEKIIKILSYFGQRSLELYLCQCVCLNIGCGTEYVRIITIFMSVMIISNILVYIIDKMYVLKFILFGKVARCGGN